MEIGKPHLSDHHDTDYRVVIIYAAVSMLLHVALFAIIIYGSPLLDSPGPITTMNISLDAFEIDHESLSDSAARATMDPPPPPDDAESMADSSAPEEAAEPETPDAISVQEPIKSPVIEKPPAPEKPEQQPVPQKQPKLVKPKTTKPAVIPQEDPAKVRADRIAKAVARITREVEKQGTGGGSPHSSGINLRGEKSTSILELYKVEVAYIIQQNWAFPEPLAGGRTDAEAILTFRVLPGGQISNLRITKSSGNTYLDQSAMDAVKKSNPVMPHPDFLKAPYIEISLLCGSSGLK